MILGPDIPGSRSKSAKSMDIFELNGASCLMNKRCGLAYQSKVSTNSRPFLAFSFYPTSGRHGELCPD